jgi:hypothetical protein
VAERDTSRFLCDVWIILRTEGVFALINALKGYEWCMKTRLIMEAIQGKCVRTVVRRTCGFSSFIFSIAVCRSPLCIESLISTLSLIDSKSVLGCMFASIANLRAAAG